jgi:hypothetical protein
MIEKISSNNSLLTILLIISGAHGFKVLEDIGMIEIKQGLYNDDKVFIKTASKLDPIK